MNAISHDTDDTHSKSHSKCQNSTVLINFDNCQDCHLNTLTINPRPSTNRPKLSPNIVKEGMTS